jgi:elongation factor 1-beta
MIMGEVAIVYKVTPEGTEVDLNAMQDKIKETLPEQARLNKIEEKPLAFGLKFLEVQIILDDKKGGSDEIESWLAGLEGVQNVDVVQMGLL